MVLIMWQNKPTRCKTAITKYSFDLKILTIVKIMLSFLSRVHTLNKKSNSNYCYKKLNLLIRAFLHV